jgi:hypothetical protein
MGPPLAAGTRPHPGGLMPEVVANRPSQILPDARAPSQHRSGATCAIRHTVAPGLILAIVAGSYR